jgi:hypothetical protein
MFTTIPTTPAPDTPLFRWVVPYNFVGICDICQEENPENCDDIVFPDDRREFLQVRLRYFRTSGFRVGEKTPCKSNILSSPALSLTRGLAEIAGRSDFHTDH